jgi:biofilm PGA synthesis lipoprotein PgaB
VMEHIRGKRPLPERTVAITVDDAFSDIYTEGWPRVKRRGWPMTVFANTDAIDQKRSGALTWEQMREMQAGGVQFANHTSTHAHLIRRLAGESESAWRHRIIADIEHAQRRLTEELGDIPRFFVYPYGEYNQSLLEIIDELGYIGFGQHSGPVGFLSDLRAVPRFPMGGSYSDLDGFRVKVNALPLPVISVDPADPLLALESERPELRITLGEGAYSPEQITCYVTGQGGGDIQLDGDRLTIRANRPLPVGRSRYNCTVRHLKENRYYWFSHPWIRRLPNGGWYGE